MTGSQSAVLETPAPTRRKVKEKEKAAADSKPRKQPRYNVVLWDDTEHTFDYVIRMMKNLFGYPEERGYQLAKEVDASGRVICLTTTREHAELKRDQIRAFGKDPQSNRSKGSMFASIEPAPE